MTRVNELVVLMDGADAGRLTREGDRVMLTYQAGYRRSDNATPLSTGLPLTAQTHTGRRVSAFLDGLLPDSEGVRGTWARQFQTRTNPFDLLAEVGEDCAGAVQFVRPERLDRLAPGGVEWLDDDDIAAWIADLRNNPDAWLPEIERGQFSLAGAQSKFALLRDGDRWGRPYGATPTTHIVKPTANGFTDHEVNEHLSLSVARSLGLAAAHSEIISFGQERAVVVERYDRINVSGAWRRVHQEDMCQALGVPPSRKYENQQGPTAANICELLRSNIGSGAADAVHSFVDALAFNWLIGGTDAHAKNYSILLAGRKVRFAPLYDLASALPYVSSVPTQRRPGELDGPRLRLAMSVGGTSLIREVRVRDWESMADQLALDATALIARINELAERLPEALTRATHDDAVTSLPSDMPQRFETRVRNHVDNCRSVLNGRAPFGRRR
jgi:serine/threonine-protein kinase HipA